MRWGSSTVADFSEYGVAYALRTWCLRTRRSSWMESVTYYPSGLRDHIAMNLPWTPTEHTKTNHGHDAMGRPWTEWPFALAPTTLANGRQTTSGAHMCKCMHLQLRVRRTAHCLRHCPTGAGHDDESDADRCVNLVVQCCSQRPRKCDADRPQQSRAAKGDGTPREASVDVTGSGGGGRAARRRCARPCDVPALVAVDHAPASRCGRDAGSVRVASCH